MKRYADRFDVFVRTHAEAKRFGLRRLKVSVIQEKHKP